MAILRLIRKEYGKITSGSLYIHHDGKSVFVCSTLEPSSSRSLHPCIPKGRYPLAVTFSPKFRKNLPLLKDVPNRDCIRIHTGNTDEDTLGCILVGFEFDGLRLVHSKIAFDYLMNLIKVYKIQTIEISDYGI